MWWIIFFLQHRSQDLDPGLLDSKDHLFPVSYAVFLPSVNTSWAPTMHQALCWAQRRTKMSRKHCLPLRERNKNLPILPIFNSRGRASFFPFFLAVLGLHCCMQALSSWERGLLSSCGAWTSHQGGFSCCRRRVEPSRAHSLQQLWHTGLFALWHMESSQTRDGTLQWQVHS